MTHADRKTRFDTAADTKPAPRPQIWIEGQQRPRFNLTAFGKVSLAMAKRDLAPELVDAARRLERASLAVAQGRRHLTPRRFAAHDLRVGGWVLALAGLFWGAHGLLDPVDPDLTLAYPLIIHEPGPRPAPAGPTAPTRDEPTLQAIRSAMFYGSHDPAPHPTHTDNAAPVHPTVARSTLWLLACHGLLTLSLAFALPLAGLRALVFHLQGGDLAEWS